MQIIEEVKFLMARTSYILHLAKEYDDSSDHSTPEKCTYIVNREETDEEEAQCEEAENGEVRVQRKKTPKQSNLNLTSFLTSCKNTAFKCINSINIDFNT